MEKQRDCSGFCGGSKNHNLFWWGFVAHAISIARREAGEFVRVVYVFSIATYETKLWCRLCYWLPVSPMHPVHLTMG
jgi:hypothetical protein